MAYDTELFCKLYEVFPDSFDATAETATYEYENGPFGQEKVCTGKETVTLRKEKFSILY